MTITVQLPDEIQKQLESEWTDLGRHALEGLLVEAYRTKKLSSEEVGQALGFTSRWQTLHFLSERGAYPNYEREDFERDMKNLSQLEEKLKK
jgi:predicted HTH domain antitoxin